MSHKVNHALHFIGISVLTALKQTIMLMISGIIGYFVAYTLFSTLEAFTTIPNEVLEKIFSVTFIGGTGILAIYFLFGIIQSKEGQN